MDKKEIHLADWVLPVTSPPIREGAVVFNHDRIIDFGKSPDILKKYGRERKEHSPAIIIPSLVNAHTHLELSCLKGKIKGGKGFINWIKEIVAARASMDQEEAKKAIVKAIEEIDATGTSLVGEISNLDWSLPYLFKSPLRGIIFLEVLGFSENIAAEAMGNLRKKHLLFAEKAQKKNFKLAFTCHSPYSVSKSLFTEVKEEARRKNLPVCIHLEESEEEMLFTRTGEGPFKELLWNMGQRETGWNVPGTTPVKYLEGLGIIDEKTICVHMVKADDVDINTLKKYYPAICICPRSNRKIGVGKAPVEKFLRASLLCCLGTDSLASNDDLNLFSEMKALKNDHTGLREETIIEMATINGAKALGFEKQYGSIERGKKPDLLSLNFSSLQGIDDPCGAVVSPNEEFTIEKIPLRKYES